MLAAMTPISNRLDPQAAAEMLGPSSPWRVSDARGGILSLDLVFPDFAHAFAFMTQVALMAEKRDHHPEWSNVHARVSIVLTTHDEGGLTMKDIEMAHGIEEACARLGGVTR